MNWIDNAISVESRMLSLRAQRAEVIATNIANADTPGYKARDVRFSDVMGQVASESLQASAPGHFSPGIAEAGSTVLREGSKENANGNTVSREFEQAAYTQNAIQYMATLRFLNGSVQGLMKALRGD
ncbi:MAG: flagellar basal body rod protein FlgB [Pseudomonadota bacterium]